MTDSQKKALEILRDHGPMTAGWFAERMWPDSPNWGKHFNSGSGCVVGKGMRLCGGSYLGRLRKIGLVHRGGERFNMYKISSKGLALLDQS